MEPASSWMLVRFISTEPQQELQIFFKCYLVGVPFMAQQLTNPPRIHEDVGLIPGLAQWVGDLALA